MIYKNGKEWTGWREELGKSFKLKKSVKFYLTSHYQGVKIVDKKKMITYPESLALMPIYTAMMGDGACEIRYVIKPMPVRSGKKGGETAMGFSPTEIIFRNGVLEVRKDQLDLWYFLTNHPRCETNPQYFTKDGKINENAVTLAVNAYSHFIFRERNEEREQEISFDREKAVIQAKHFIINEMTKEEAREIYKSYNEPDWEEATLSRMKNFLLAKAGEDPKKFMEELNSEVRTFKSKIHEAVQAEVIFFDLRLKVWKFSGVETTEPIMRVAKGDDHVLALAKFLQMKDNGAVYETICNKVLEAETAAVE